MPSSNDLGPLDPVLEGVYRRGYRIRRTRRIARVGTAAVVLQLALALPLLATADSDTNLRVTSPAGDVDETTTTTAATEVAGVVYEATTTTAAPTTTVAPSTTTTAHAPAAVYGVIGAGEGGHGHAYLRDASGHQWEAVTDDYGNYRIEGLVPGRYDLSLAASSAVYPCETPPAPACLGPASVMGPVRTFDLRPGDQRREDFEGWGEPTTPATTPTVQQHPTTTTTTEVPAQ